MTHDAYNLNGFTAVDQQGDDKLKPFFGHTFKCRGQQRFPFREAHEYLKFRDARLNVSAYKKVAGVFVLQGTADAKTGVKFSYEGVQRFLQCWFRTRYRTLPFRVFYIKQAGFTAIAETDAVSAGGFTDHTSHPGFDYWNPGGGSGSAAWGGNTDSKLFSGVYPLSPTRAGNLYTARCAPEDAGLADFTVIGPTLAAPMGLSVMFNSAAGTSGSADARFHILCSVLFDSFLPAATAGTWKTVVNSAEIDLEINT